MFSLKSIENMMGETKSAAVSKQKFPKRKRVPSKMEPEEDSVKTKNQLTKNTNQSVLCNGSRLESTHRPTKKKSQVTSKTLKTMNVSKESIYNGKKKKKRKGPLKSPGMPDFEKNLEKHVALNGVHENRCTPLNLDDGENVAERKTPKKTNVPIRGGVNNYLKNSDFPSEEMKKESITKESRKQSKKKFGDKSNKSKKMSKLEKKNAKSTDLNEGLEANSVELTRKQELVCTPEGIIPVSDDSYIVVILPEQSLYFHGLISVRPLIGSIRILGYELKELEKKDILSFSTHALIGVKALKGNRLNIQQHTHLLEYGMTKEQLEGMIDKQKQEVIVLEVRKISLPIAEQLRVIGHQRIMYPEAFGGHESLGGMLVTKETCSRYRLVNETSVWMEFVENLKLYFECGNAPRVLVCGGKGVGKSTFLKYVINSLLSKKGTKVLCLDCDPGQSEFSLPSCVSLTQVTEPLLGPSYTHLANSVSSNSKQILIGGTSPQFGLQRYIMALKDLFERSTEQPDCPLVINTMGWTAGTGLDLILDTIRIVQPTHVAQIWSGDFKSNYCLKLDASVVQKTVGGVCTRQDKVGLHYSLTEFKSLSGRRDRGISFTPKLLRELAVLLQLSYILIDQESNKNVQGTDSNSVVIQWSKVALHVCGAKIPRERILQVLNGNLIALCQVDPLKIESVGVDLPKHLIDDTTFGQCWGWGVVRGIDPLTKSLHIITDMPSEKIIKNVNVIIKPDLHLPDEFLRLFNKGEGPYFQKLRRLGAGRLKVSRVLKPGMATHRKKKDN